MAHLHFFRQRGEHAWLVNLYFTGDTTHISTTQSEFDQQRSRDATDMQLDPSGVAGSVPVFMPAQPDAYALLREHIENRAGVLS